MEVEVTRSIEEQLSAFLDGELPPEELALLIRRLERDEAYRATLARYVTMGAIMRSEPLLRGGGQVRHNVLQAIATETNPVPQQDAIKPRRTGARRWAAAASIAIAVFAGLFAATQLIGPNQTPADLRVASEPAVPSAEVAVVSTGPAVAANVAAETIFEASGNSRQIVAPSAAVGSPQRRQQMQLNRNRMTSYLISHGEHARSFHGAMADSRMFVQQASFEE